MTRTFSERARISWRLFKGRARYLRKAVRNVLGEHPRECPLCGWEGAFLNFGTPPKFDALCPDCRSTPRHRLLKLAQDRDGLIPPGAEILHFAAERSLKPLIASLAPARYVAADKRPGFDIQIDIEDIALPPESVDVIICSHVLEHVDDGKALAELYRILRPGGRAILMVPIIEGADRTYEDPAITNWRDRRMHFGGGTHVRWYGRDFRDRVRAAGFTLREYAADDYEPFRHALERGERVFVAERPA